MNAFSGLVDSLWANVTSPYGPVFLWLAGVNATVMHHNELWTVVGFRVMALAGVILIAVFLPRLARSYGRDGSLAFVLGVLNPLVLLHLVAGAHNDALDDRASSSRGSPSPASDGPSSGSCSARSRRW